MTGTWKKLKMAFGTRMCLHLPRVAGDSTPSSNVAPMSSEAVSPMGSASNCRQSSPIHSSSSSRVSKSGSRSSRRTCAICLITMKAGNGHAIFTAECSHSFHFHCIASNVKHGSQICPVCRAKWKEIPFQISTSDYASPRTNPVGSAPDDPWMAMVRQMASPRSDTGRQISSLFHGSEPVAYDDDEALDQQPHATERNTSNDGAAVHSCTDKVEVKTYPEISAVPRSVSRDHFSVLVHVKAPFSIATQNNSRSQAALPLLNQPSRAPVDLVTVLDVSGSMAGTKLALLKRAMGFVIQNLGPSDRLSVISFSSTAHRLFPLSRMTDLGRQQALRAVNSLSSNGGTNIAEGLKKGAKVLVDRKLKNPVASIIMLSDGQDTYTFNGSSSARPQIDYESLLPVSILHNNHSGMQQIPVHTFGVGADHDPVTAHTISNASGGTFSVIENESTIQDAFAQCIGGLLSVVVQDLQVEVRCIHPTLQLGSIQAGSYQASITERARCATVHFGDLYAEEERDFLLTLNIPVDESEGEMPLLKVKCVYKNPITKEPITLDEVSEVQIQRLDRVGEQAVSLEVDRQRNRFRAAEAISEARVAAERGDLAGAVSVLDNCYRTVSESASGRGSDQLCAALCAELKEMKERMATKHMYEASGRAYMLSGLSSHSWQRATARGDSVDMGSAVQSYQTPSMVDMVTRSRTMILEAPPSQRTLIPTHSFPVRALQPPSPR
ncbi:uncharacterized protein LOC111795962 isoform X2 [Cucurbita pepo subsp. pepo]|uniref:uncharacterized protein LOC111795962 isoform X1 n=1 Tax=Cucurbita pepo subsp. pepo TaxID=3664 RepID=UPI000C9D2746|nr:uncharacterized protein LOC111795962 isoform X1 [Cucurbita pepo subsp. pepo]XP_023534386.1 uncharacterized protein LOC111795962 isoform X2 [Cucurbita pepo subsp. pepo]